MGEEVKPVRLQLSRRKGFDLQAVSLATNGLPAIKVCRPGLWGNPFVVTDRVTPGVATGGRYVAVPTIEDAVDCYRLMLLSVSREGQRAFELRKRLPEIRGHNLACWCKPNEPCHADVLLEFANEGLPVVIPEPSP